MSLRILGGFAKNFKVETLKTDITRPTSVMLRRKLFDSKQDLSGYTFIDLCAGSGSVGLEALSRGADRVLFNELDHKVYKVLSENLKAFKEKFSLDNFSLKRGDFLDFLKQLKFEQNQSFILFFDPPYEKINMYDDFFKLLKDLNIEMLVIVEACIQKTMKLKDFEQKYGNIKKLYKQGTSFFALYEIEGKL